jgi:hypothetical protein
MQRSSNQTLYLVYTVFDWMNLECDWTLFYDIASNFRLRGIHVVWLIIMLLSSNIS